MANLAWSYETIIMKKLYYLLFYKTHRFFEEISNDGWSEWKALVIIGGAQMLLLVELGVWLALFTKEIFNFPKYSIVLIGTIIATINYFALFNNENWRQYEEEFKKYPENKSKIAGWLSLLFLVGVLGSLIFSFYQMSLIDWSKYR